MSVARSSNHLPLRTPQASALGGGGGEQFGSRALSGSRAQAGPDWPTRPRSLAVFTQVGKIIRNYSGCLGPRTARGLLGLWTWLQGLMGVTTVSFLQN